MMTAAGQVKMRKRASSEPSLGLPSSLRCTLASHSFFAGLPTEALENVLERVHVRRITADTTIIQEGTTGHSLFLLISGTATVWSERSEVELAELHAGTFFGEIGALYDVKRTATVLAKSNVTLAVISREALLGALRDHPEWQRRVALEAQRRYMAIRGPQIAPGHAGASHYIETALKFKFPSLFSDRPSIDIYNFVHQGHFAIEPDGNIVAFFNPETSMSRVFFVLTGLLQYRSGIEGKIAEFRTGSVASIPPDSSVLGHLIAKEETSFLRVPWNIYQKLIAKESIPEDEQYEDSSSEEDARPLLGGLESDLRGTFSNRRHTLDYVCWHDQLPHHRSQHGALTTALAHSLSLTTIHDLPDMVILQEILVNHSIKFDEPTKLMPGRDASQLFLSHLNNNLTDALLGDIADAFSQRLLALSLSGARITDASLPCLSRASLQRLELNDCVLLTSEGLKTLLLRCHDLRELRMRNCPGFTDACLETLSQSGSRISELELSFCRGLGVDCWIMLTRFAAHLNRLVLHRIVALNEPDVRRFEPPQPFVQLCHLDLRECAFLTTNALRVMLKSMPSLESLSLSFCTGLDETIPKAMSYLEDAPLHVLDLSYCTRAVTDRSMAALLGSVPRLKSISIRGTRHPTKETLNSLAKLSELEHVDVEECHSISPADYLNVAKLAGWR